MIRQILPMYEYLNNNPNKNKVGDCVIRAISTALNQSWEETYIELCIQGYLMSDLPSSNSVWNAYLKGKGYTREFVRKDCPDCYTIKDFAEEFPNGTFIIGTGTHATVIKDGCILDNWDCSCEQPIYYYIKGDYEK